MLDYFLFVPFIVQAVALGFDEVYYHQKRGLPKWERIGHPIDTLTVVAALSFVLFVPFSSEMIKIYVGMALLSCLMVTKDEFVHKHHCPASEQWLHALLFVNHPIMLISAGLMWAAMGGALAPEWLAGQLTEVHLFSSFLLVQAGSATLFMLYQIIYWNFLWKEKKA